MAIRVTATSTASVPIYVTYVCSKCNHVNCIEHHISESRSSQTSAMVFLERAKDKMSDKAIDASKKALKNRILKVSEERKNGIYRTAEFSCRCSNCKNKEPWSKMSYYLIKKVLSKLLIVAVMIAAVFLLGELYNMALQVGIVYAALFIMTHIYFICNTSIMQKKISLLPEKSLPLISMDKEDILKKYEILKILNAKEQLAERVNK